MGEFSKVAGVSEIPEGQGKLVHSSDKDIAVFHVAGKFYAMDNGCPHRGAPLAEGELKDNIVVCPWHSWEFDVTTGQSPINPAACVKTYPCKVEGSDVFVQVS